MGSDSALDSLDSDCVELQTITYEDNIYASETNGTDDILVAGVTSVELNGDIKDLENGLEICLATNQVEYEGQSCGALPVQCVYWDEEALEWSSKGCTVLNEKSDVNTTCCLCVHLTDFSVLVAGSDV